ncbi:hypothetical protein O6H91_03G091300 [Diphasiastrum complanatum]|uniref:Uncharacterized protein n=1 Tax=Diphasiastrum complanatum TaxID=34168 RepID=A0ACC2E906_DIPCM|nr:hypothetical protein O6H91_03G091300 [Diphasiastrum complanatum]
MDSNSFLDEQGSDSAGQGFPVDSSDDEVRKASGESESSSDSKGDGFKIVEKERLTVPELEGFLKHMEAAFAADDPRIGVISLRLGQEHDLHAGSPHKILAYANRALKILGKGSKDTIEVGMCLHLIGSAYYKMGKYDTCLANLSRALQIISAKEEEGQDCRALKFAVHFLLGDTMTATGKHDDALGTYTLGLSIQEELLESGHPQLAYNCRRVAEAFTQVVRFEEALPLCQKALQIHRGYHGDYSMEEASDRRLLAVIYRGLEDHEKALREHKLVKDILTSKGKTREVDMVDIAIADSYISLQRYDDAVAVLESAISRLEETSPLRGLAHVNLAKTYLLQQRLDYARQECERGLEIFSNSRTEEANLLTIAEGFTELASIFEGMRETEQAIELLEQALSLYQKIPGHLNAVAGTQAQIGMLLYLGKKVQEALPYMEDAASQLRASFGDDHPTLALVLNQMGLANLELKKFPLAAELFEKCKHILSASYGAGHADTLAIYHNLVNVYSCLGRYREYFLSCTVIF